MWGTFAVLDFYLHTEIHRKQSRRRELQAKIVNFDQPLLLRSKANNFILKLFNSPREVRKFINPAKSANPLKRVENSKTYLHRMKKKQTKLSTNEISHTKREG